MKKIQWVKNKKFIKSTYSGVYYDTTEDISIQEYTWSILKGKIPAGYMVVNKDNDLQNNAIDNLQLIKIPAKETIILVSEIGGPQPRQPKKDIDAYVLTKKFECVHCGREFTGIKDYSRFCSEECKMYYLKPRKVFNKDDKVSLSYAMGPYRII